MSDWRDYLGRAERGGYWALLCAAAVLTLLFAWGAMDALPLGPGEPAAAAPAGGADAGEAKETRDEPHAGRVKLIGEQNPFAPPEDKSFKGRLTSVVGDKALFNDSQLAGVGEDALGAKVLTLGADWVQIEYDGQKRTLWVFGEREGAGPDAEAEQAGPAGEGGSKEISPKMLERLKKLPPERRQDLPAEVRARLEGHS
ncbi:MAG: hypothetical protein ACOCTI_05840 [Phycisphaeraceae bacterium]